MYELVTEREKCLSFFRRPEGRIELSKKGFRSIPPQDAGDRYPGFEELQVRKIA